MSEEFDVVVVGAGVGGLSAALGLTARGASVLLVDRGSEVGGKLRTVQVEGRRIDAGPTVLTMRHVFDQAFEDAGLRLDDLVRLQRCETLARHAWPDGSWLDLYADESRTTDAIAELSGREDAEGFRRFRRHARAIFERVEAPFILADEGSLIASLRREGLRAASHLARVDWHRNLWRALETFFADPRLRQLFGRYATYYGSSPFRAPATLSLIAHVELEGMWTVEGGMIALARALRRAFEVRRGQVALETEVTEVLIEDGRAVGVRLADGTRIGARVVIVNAEPAALSGGYLGRAASRAVTTTKAARSYSAMTFCAVAEVQGRALLHHNVFFSSDYVREFAQLDGAGILPDEPTVYVCAPDRSEHVGTDRPERLFLLVNAPPRGDERDFAGEVERCATNMLAQLRRCGVAISARPEEMVATTPSDFAKMYPGTGGSLYGPATHGAFAPFSRPAPKTRIPGLLLVGGGVHPGAGLPMVALSGRIATRHASALLDSTSRSSRVGMRGGMSMGSRTTASTP